MRTRRPRLAAVVRAAFAGFCLPPEVIVLAVRWYLCFALSYRDVEELLAERGVEVDHVTIYRWVQRFTPLTSKRCWRSCTSSKATSPATPQHPTSPPTTTRTAW